MSLSLDPGATVQLATVRVLIADHRGLFREALRAALEGNPDLAVVGDIGDPRLVLDEVAQCRPDVAIINAEFAGADPLRLTRRLHDIAPACAPLFLTERDDPEFIVDALKAGARGCLTKDSSLSDLPGAVRAVAAGEVLIPPRLLSRLIDQLVLGATRRDEALRRLSRLTRRERTVLALLSSGGGNESVAQALYISPHTARTHIQNVISKLGVHSRLEAAMFVAQNGLRDELVGAET